MDNDSIKIRAQDTVSMMLCKVKKIIATAEDEERHLDDDEIDNLLDCWKTIHLALDAMK